MAALKAVSNAISASESFLLRRCTEELWPLLRPVLTMHCDVQERRRAALVNAALSCLRAMCLSKPKNSYSGQWVWCIGELAVVLLESDISDTREAAISLFGALMTADGDAIWLLLSESGSSAVNELLEVLQDVNANKWMC